MKLTSHRPLPILVLLISCCFRSQAAAYDDAEILSERVPNQTYRALDEISSLQRGKIEWLIYLWACDASSFEVIKVTGGASTPYAIKITPKGNNPIYAMYPYNTRAYSIHLLAASLEDAMKIRRALIREIEVQQRNIETREKKPPGYLKRLVQSWKT